MSTLSDDRRRTTRLAASLLNRSLVAECLSKIEATRAAIDVCIVEGRPLDRFPLLEKLNVEYDRLKKIVAFYLPLEDKPCTDPGWEFAKGERR